MPKINLNLSVRIADSVDSGDCTGQERLGCAALTTEFQSLSALKPQMFISCSYAMSNKRRSAYDSPSGTKANVNYRNSWLPGLPWQKKRTAESSPSNQAVWPRSDICHFHSYLIVQQ